MLFTEFTIERPSEIALPDGAYDVSVGLTINDEVVDIDVEVEAHEIALQIGGDALSASGQVSAASLVEALAECLLTLAEDEREEALTTLTVELRKRLRLPTYTRL